MAAKVRAIRFAPRRFAAYVSVLLALAILLVPILAGAQGGTPLISGAPTVSNNPAGPPLALSTVSVSGQPFTQAYHVAVNGTSPNLYDAQLGWTTIAPIQTGDNLRINFWVRKISPLDTTIIRARVSLELANAPYTNFFSTTFPCSLDTWMKVSLPVTAPANYATGAAALRFNCAFGPQTFEIGGLSVVNSGPSAGLPAGTPLLPASLAPYNGQAGTVATVSTVGVTGQSFTTAYHIVTSGNSANIYDSQLGWATTSAASQNDTILLTFWARRLAPLDGNGIVGQVVFEQTGSPYTHSLTAYYPCDGATWQKFSVPFSAATNYPTGGGSLRFQFAAGPQTFEIGGITLTNYKTALAPSQLPALSTYPGRDPNAGWRADAAARIAQIRQGDLTIHVQDAGGAPLPNAIVTAQMTRHAFRFGSAIAADVLNGTGADNDTYRGQTAGLFTTTVLENALKWPNWEDNRQPALDSLAWLASQNLPVRGHNLIWPSLTKPYFMPADCAGLSAPALRTRIDNHFSDILGATQGKCYSWDVINEPYDNYDVQGRIGGVAGVPQSNGVLGNAEMLHWYQNARALEPNASLYLNDYDILEAGGYDTTHQDYTYALMQYFLSSAIPIDGLGMQSHFTPPLTPFNRLQSILDRFGALPVAFSVTEFDVDTLDTSLQADYTRDFLTLIFSDAKFNDFLMWGFWEGAHWRPNAALYRQDWTSKPNALAFNDLLFNQWWTNASGATDSAGQYEARGFKGTYNVAATYGGLTQTAAVTLDTTGAVTLTIPNPTVSGKVLLEGQVASAPKQSVTFQFRKYGTTVIVQTRTLSLGPSGTFSITSLPFGQYSLWIKSARNLAQLVTVDTRAGSMTNLNVTLPGGDANNDNSVDNLDLGILASAYATSTGESGFDARADFNGDGSVDNLDLAILANNYTLTGDN